MSVLSPSTPTTLNERSNLVLDFARVLYVNGQTTDQVFAAAARLGNILGVRLSTMARWGELQLQVRDGDTKLVVEATANPSGVDMDRVAAAMRAIDELAAGRITVSAANESIRAIAKAPPTPAWVFTLAAAAGAVALSVIFGIEHLLPAVIIFVSAAAGAVLRRALARYKSNLFVQPFVRRCSRA